MVSQVAAAVNGVVEKQAVKIRSKNQLRRLKAKQKKAEAPTNVPEHTSPKKVVADNSNFVYVSELSDSALEAFSNVFARFQLPLDENTDEKASAPMKSEVIYSEDDMESSGDSDEEKKSLSKKKQRKLGRLTVVELKQLIKELE
ncbi:hypothetical protein C0993_011009, partial [Termitomyces sp. T159_Od127]